MRFVRCGELEVSCIGFGARSFGAAQKSAGEWEEALDYALDCGINLIDTAPVYQNGRSEELLGRMLKGKRGQVFLSTKVGTHGTAAILTPDAARRTLYESMRRLQTDYIDILFVHYPDPRVEYGAIARALQVLMQEGSIRCYGLSNFDPRELSRWPVDDPPAALQLPYSLLQQEQYNEVVDFMTCHDIVPMVYTPMAAGLLTLPPEKIDAAGGYPEMFYSLLSSEGKTALARLHQAAAEHNTGAAVLAVAWSLKEGKNIVLAGMGSRAHIRQALAALEICKESFIDDLPVIPQPVMPMEGTVTEVIKTGPGETLVLVKLAALDIDVPLWADAAARAGDRLKIDGLTGKLIR